MTDFFCGVTTVLFSDPVLLLEIIDSLYCISGPMTFEVGGCSVMVNGQIINNI